MSNSRNSLAVCMKTTHLMFTYIISISSLYLRLIKTYIQEIGQKQ